MAGQNCGCAQLCCCNAGRFLCWANGASLSVRLVASLLVGEMVRESAAGAGQVVLEAAVSGVLDKLWHGLRLSCFLPGNCQALLMDYSRNKNKKMPVRFLCVGSEALSFHKGIYMKK